jgi:hypothetical protein
MKDETKAILIWGLIIGGALLGWRFYRVYETSRDAASLRKATIEKQEKGLRIVEFAKRHDAIIAWESSLPERGMVPAGPFVNGPFVIDFSRALIRSNAQPVLFTASLSDVMEMDGVATAHFTAFSTDDESSTNLLPGFPIAILDLKCSPEQIAELTKVGVFRGVMFALIAKVEKVSRPEFRAVARSGGGELGDETSIEIETDSSTILVKGTCVDLLRMEERKP